eukprot:Phypoly_transcript_20114.p1 GENE.Phypoly_transcript_20114~~Phypoly_transcript_20114.p1  ORF type:complete len:183 (+),score=37.66 Phypoly_transcript_20114:127-675(+)
MNSLGGVVRRGTLSAVTLSRRLPTQHAIRRGVCGNGWYGWHGWRHHNHGHGAEEWNRFQQHFQKNLRDCFKNMSEHMDKSMKTAETTIHTKSTLHEQPEAYRILVEMPGVAKESVAVEVEEGILTIEGKKTVEGETKKYSVKYDITNDKVEPSQIKAKLENGILELTLPKNPEKKPFVINVE